MTENDSLAKFRFVTFLLISKCSSRKTNPYEKSILELYKAIVGCFHPFFPCDVVTDLGEHSTDRAS